MAIKRWAADADTTITNAYKQNMRTRATGSNMGLADSLEIFHIYGQQDSGSSENARILIKFPISNVSSSRNSGDVPTSGNVDFYLKMFNVEHPFTLPRGYNLAISAISKSWDEGSGMDMDSYSNSGSANWISAASASSGVTNWTTQGGDYHSEPVFTASFDKGTEDIEVNITDLVEQWLSGAALTAAQTDGAYAKQNYGFGIKLSGTAESALSSSYTKKFSARGTEFFFKKPILEARWNSSRQDDRGNLYYSSSLANSEDNLNTVYLYNYVRGQLRNIPSVGTGLVYVSVYSGSKDNTEPSGTRLVLVSDGTHVTSGNPYVITGGYVATGIYSASFALTAAATKLTNIFEVWHSGTTQYHTGTITPQTLQGSNMNPTTKYAMAVSNLKSSYNSTETARFRISTRLKDWSPNIYSKAKNEPELSLVESASYRVYRVSDNMNVVPYGTSSTYHTLLSYDISGSYFDLDMSLLEPDYSYAIKIALYNGAMSSFVEQDETFKFRVEPV